MRDEERAGFVGQRGNYSLLKNLRVEIEGEERAFFLCFWVYLVKSFTFPLTLLQKAQREATADSPFLIISEKEVTLFGLDSLHEEALPLDVSSQSLGFEFPLERWVHFGCEVSENLIRLHIDGKIVGERAMSLLYKKEFSFSNGVSNRIVLVSANGDKTNQGFIYNLENLPATLSVQDHHSKDPPIQLCIDKSSASEIEIGNDGVWSIVGGKVSCRRNFFMNVLLLDAFGRPVDSESEVVASLLYVDTGEPVERTSDDEAPLLASYDGIEISTLDRPSRLLNGRASFKLKLAQLSSKCHSRLFRIRFCLSETEAYPFLEVFSPPIRSISRNQNNRVPSSSITSRRPTSTFNPTSQLSLPGVNFMEAGKDFSNKERSDLMSKRPRLGPNGISETAILESPEEDCNSHAWPKTKVGDRDTVMTSSTMQTENSAEDMSSTDSESTELRNSDPKSTSSSGSSISDMTMFKYGLAGIPERTFLLKEIASSASDEEILSFADQVSLYSGCSHHRSQIMMTKRLVEEGTVAWNSISQNISRVPWKSMLFEIEIRFMKISRCSSRSLSHQDFELLRKICGCEEYVSRENFEQMWCWMYPVAHALSRDPLNEMWGCASSPKWIEGFVTKEEAECSLAAGEPGTFVLRFPTSRSWPHPDAGSLVVTYVGPDRSLRHRLLSLHHLHSSSQKDKEAKPLQEMLLEEPELSRLGRVIRSH